MYISLIQRLVVQFATQFLNNLLLLLLKDGNGASEVGKARELIPCLVHLVSTSLVKEMNDHDPGQVVVMWPCKGKEPESWVGTRVNDTSSSYQPGEGE